MSTLICAARDDRKTNEDEDEIKSVYDPCFHSISETMSLILRTRYSSFVRIGTGLSYADYVWIRQRNWKPFDKKNIPSWYQASKKGTDDKGDIYLEPEEYVAFWKVQSNSSDFLSSSCVKLISTGSKGCRNYPIRSIPYWFYDAFSSC